MKDHLAGFFRAVHFGILVLSSFIFKLKNNCLYHQSEFKQGQVRSAKENVAAKIESIKKIRDELESLKPEELPAQLPIINRKLIFIDCIIFFLRETR